MVDPPAAPAATAADPDSVTPARSGRALIHCRRCHNVLAEWRVVGGELRVVVRLRAQGRNAHRLAGAPGGGRRTVVAGPDSTIGCERCGAVWGTPGG